MDEWVVDTYLGSLLPLLEGVEQGIRRENSTGVEDAGPDDATIPSIIYFLFCEAGVSFVLFLFFFSTCISFHSADCPF